MAESVCFLPLHSASTDEYDYATSERSPTYEYEEKVRIYFYYKHTYTSLYGHGILLALVFTTLPRVTLTHYLNHLISPSLPPSQPTLYLTSSSVYGKIACVALQPPRDQLLHFYSLTITSSHSRKSTPIEI
jgi:hypothetical protein